MRSSRPAGGRDGWGALRFFLLVWVLLATAGSAWAVATTLFFSVGEDAQVVKAVARGQLARATALQPGEYFPVMTSVEVPECYATARSTTQCSIWDTLQPAGCAAAFRADDVTGEVDTWFGRYPPLD